MNGCFKALTFILVLSNICHAASGSRELSPSDVYSKVTLLNDRLQLILNSAKGDATEIPFDSVFLNRNIQPRHVFQRALEVERKLIGFINLNSIKATKTSAINILDYSPNEVWKLINKMDHQVTNIMNANGIEAEVEAQSFEAIQPENVYRLLGRMELFLTHMGAPISRPSQVLRRARAITQLMNDLCNYHKCGKVIYIPIPDKNKKRPLDVYKHAYAFTHKLEEYVSKSGIFIKGGIYAEPPSKEVITPSEVNTTLGTVLADVIAIADAQGINKRLKLGNGPEDVSPSEVWREVDYSLAILNHILKTLSN